ncbi:MAG: penicillin-binding protein 2 [Candidatus Omnitrophica bacterium]|nr:penicillin-binding protein 2 [Candidatus Omnitrophota bacterium]MCF7894247.1 penicillin-binding protein 2 [Candidatus Omnitrophota bacterium]
MLFNPKSFFSKNQSSVKLLKRVVLISFSLLLLVLFNYQITKGSYYLRRAQNNYVRVIPLYSLRGSIFDRNGVVLAKDMASFNLAVFPYQIKNKKDSLFKKISQDLGLDQKIIYKNYKKNLRGFFSPTNIVTNISKKKALHLKEAYPKSLSINPTPQRKYLRPLETAHILGYVKKASSLKKQLKKYGYKPLERIGIYGIEQYYDSYLKGKNGGDLIEVDAAGNVVGFLGRKRAYRGKDIYLTIDSRAQEIAKKSLNKRKGTIIFLDSNSGEIITLYSSPSFDPNLFIKGKDLGSIYKNKASPLINRATQSTFPVGSLIKPLLAIAGLQENKIKPTTTFNCKGHLVLGSNRFKCWGTHGVQDLYQALAHSCNIYFYKLGLIIGPKKISSWAKKFGLDSKTFIDLPYEKKGFVPSPQWKKDKFNQSWYAGDTLNLSIGQGYLHTTPLAITLAINSIANQGYLVEPILLKEVEDAEASLAFRRTLNIAGENLKIVKKGLRKTVNQSSGTARILKNLSLEISGKTGTAQTSGRSHGWFVGFFPYKQPKYTISVFLENGGSSHQALRIAYSFLDKLKRNNIIK